MQGILHPGILPRILGELRSAGRSGVLRLSRKAQTLAILVVDDQLGLMAPRSAFLQASPGPALPGRDALIEALSWTEGTFAFDEQDPIAVDAQCPPERLPLPDAIREAIRSIESLDVVREGLGDLERVAELRTARHAPTLPPGDELLLALVDGSRTLSELAERSALPLDEARRGLYGLLCFGLIECRPRRPSPEPPTEVEAAEAVEARPEPAEREAAVEDEATQARRRELQERVREAADKNHFEALGLSRAADDQEVKEAYLRLARRYHPDSQTDPALAHLEKEREALFIRIGEAYEVLSHPKRRARYEAELLALEAGPASAQGGAATDQSPEALDAVQNALLADDAIRRANELIVEAQYWDAIQLLEGTIPRIHAKKLRHEAQVLLARAYTRNPKWVRRGEELLLSVVREDPSWVDAYFVLGTIYRNNGLKSRALTMFRKVLELKPSHKPAAVEIRALEENPTASPPARPDAARRRSSGSG
jgi:DnaJ-domain-containing protein 1